MLTGMAVGAATLEQARRAFAGLRPMRAGYAHLPVAEAFRWHECAAGVDDSDWYLVAFRSVRRPDADERLLWELDERAYRETALVPGLALYHRGALDAERRCLSLCLWDEARHAHRAATLPQHGVAAAHTGEMYESYRIERYTLAVRAGRAAITPLQPGLSAA
jgi:hypothetical protein